MLLLLVLAARAASYGDWLEAVDQVVDQQVPSLESCVTFVRPVGNDVANLAVLELEVNAAGRVAVRAKDHTMVESWIPTCMAKALSKVEWPEAPGAAKVWISLEILGLHPSRVHRSFFVPPRPSGASRTAALNWDAVQIPFRKNVKLGTRCLKVQVDDRNGDTSGRIDVEYAVDEDGYLEELGARGGDALPEMRDCVLKEFGSIRLPAGFPDTPHVVVTVEFSGEGGEWARSDASTVAAAKGYTWKYRYWLGSRSAAGSGTEPAETPPEPSFEAWVYALNREMAGNAKEFAACVLAEEGHAGDYDLLVVAGANGVDAVAAKVRSGSPGAAPCIARTMSRLPVRGAMSRWVMGARVEVLPGGVTIVHGPELVGGGAGPWPEAVLAAAQAGDSGAFLAGLGPGVVHSGKQDWSTGLPAAASLPQWVAWSASSGWPAWDRMLVGAGDPLRAEAAIQRLQPLLGGCFVEVAGRASTQAVARLDVAADGTVLVGAAVHNPLGEAPYACLVRTLQGQRVDAVGGAFTAIWPFNLASRTGR